MKIIKTISEVEGLVGLTIGNFDGVHTGHINLLRKVKKQCNKDDLKLLVITFVPHPSEVLSPKNNFQISTFKQRIDLLSKLNVDYLLELSFDKVLSKKRPDQFIQEYILKYSCVKKLFLGHDFALGSKKSGDHDYIKNYCSKSDIDVYIMDRYYNEKEAVSSSRIRTLIDDFDMPKIEKLLGRKFSITGTIMRGEGRGRKLGIPTANLQIPKNMKIPPLGVYITKVIYNSEMFYSVTNIGRNPTFNVDERELYIETHILDFDKDIYETEFEIIFVKKLREEKKFSGVKELVDQINSDISIARDFFGH